MEWCEGAFGNGIGLSDDDSYLYARVYRRRRHGKRKYDSDRLGTTAPAASWRIYRRYGDPLIR